MPDKNDGGYIVTEEAVRRCFMFLDGTAQPSDFGYDITEAANLLAAFAIRLEGSLNDPDIPPLFRERMKEQMQQAKDLARTFGEAGYLAGEQWDS